MRKRERRRDKGVMSQLFFEAICGELIARFSDWLKRLKYQEKTRISVAGTPLECMSKTCRDHAPSILLAAAASPVFFSPHRIRLPHLMHAIVTARSFGIPENSQPLPAQAMETSRTLPRSNHCINGLTIWRMRITRLGTRHQSLLRLHALGLVIAR